MILLGIMIGGKSLYGQLPISIVSAPKMEIMMGQEMANTVRVIAGIQQQISQANELIRQGRKVAQTIEVVSSAIQQVKLTQEIVRTQQSINRLINDDYAQIKNSGFFDPQELGDIAASFRSLVQSIGVHVELINGLLTSGQFKINDAERLKLLKEAKQSLQEIYSDSVTLRMKYKRLIKKRAMIAAFTSNSAQP